MNALRHLAGPVKDLMFPIVRVQAWPRLRADAPLLVPRSIAEFVDAFDGKPAALDLAMPRTDLESDIADQGRREIAALRDPADGFRAWCDLVTSWQCFTPTLQWHDETAVLLRQFDRLAGIGRGLVIRLRRTQSWNIANVVQIRTAALNGVRLLIVMDAEQISLREDLTVLAQNMSTAMTSVSDLLSAADLSFVIMGSSFPSEFASIDATNATLPIRERQLFSLLSGSPPLLRAGISPFYGDHAAVFAGEREPAFRGLPRIDYPTSSFWIYHRKPIADGFGRAAEAVVSDPAWLPDLMCWGAHEINRAASGDLTGLGSAAPWTAVRINIHLHRQANFGGDATTPVEEPWSD